MQAWQKLVAEYEPKSLGRYGGMLTEILNPTFSYANMGAELDAWEILVNDYIKQSGDVVSDSIRVGVVTGRMPHSELRTHLFWNLSQYDSYGKLRQEINNFSTAERAAPGFLDPKRRGGRRRTARRRTRRAMGRKAQLQGADLHAVRQISVLRNGPPRGESQETLDVLRMRVGDGRISGSGGEAVAVPAAD